MQESGEFSLAMKQKIYKKKAKHSSVVHTSALAYAAYRSRNLDSLTKNLLFTPLALPLSGWARSYHANHTKSILKSYWIQWCIAVKSHPKPIVGFYHQFIHQYSFYRSLTQYQYEVIKTYWLTDVPVYCRTRHRTNILDRGSWGRHLATCGWSKVR